MKNYELIDSKKYKTDYDGIVFSGCIKCIYNFLDLRLKIYFNGRMEWIFMSDLEKEDKTRNCIGCGNVFMKVEEKTLIESAIRLVGFHKIENILINLGFNPSK